MPCYTVKTYSVEFSPKNLALLTTAAKTLGGNVQTVAGVVHVLFNDGDTIAIADGQAIGQNQQKVNALRVAYSQTVMGQARQWAQAKGWTIQQTGTNKMTLSKGAR